MRSVEEGFIAKLTKKSSKIGDDGALIPEGFVVASDAFFENIHFKRSWSSLRDIAYKAVAVNVSDAVAMNARATYMILSTALPPSLSRAELAELAEGFLEAAEHFGVEIIGGDTLKNSKLDINITILAKPLGKLAYRSGIKRGHLLAYTGTLGGVKKELDALLRFNTPPKKESKLLRPVLKEQFFYAIAPYVSAAMDISDGLFFELGRLGSINRLDFEMLRPVPKRIGCSGEEYEMLFAFAPRHLPKIRAIAKKHRERLNVVAIAKRGRFTKICKPHHF